MLFEWDDQKSLANREKHGIDFETAKSLWLDDRRVEVEMVFPDEKMRPLPPANSGRYRKPRAP